VRLRVRVTMRVRVRVRLRVRARGGCRCEKGEDYILGTRGALGSALAVAEIFVGGEASVHRSAEECAVCGRHSGGSAVGVCEW
jgi:hypothetical protein